MADSIRISAPDEVRAKTKRIAALLQLYHEGLEEDTGLLSATGQQLEAAKQQLTRRRAALQAALERAKAQAPQSEAARKTQQTLETRLNAITELFQTLGRYDDAYADICRDVSVIRQKSEKFVKDGTLLSGKIGTLLTKIIESI